MAITTAAVEDGTVLTTLLGVLADQAALVGVINYLYNLRLPLLCVECLGELPVGEPM